MQEILISVIITKSRSMHIYIQLSKECQSLASVNY